MTKRSKFRGHIDRIADGYMFGWLFDSNHPERSVLFDLFINGVYRGQWSCAYFRPDLLDAGLGNGIHGFKVPLAGAIDATTDRDSVEMFVPGAGAIWLAAKDGHLREQKAMGATRAIRLERFEARLAGSDVGGSTCIANATTDASLIAGVLSRSEIYENDRLGDVQSSDFTEFLRRLKNWKGDDHQFYSWYVNDYIYTLDPRFVPLSDDEKNFIRDLVERTRSEISSPPLPKYLKFISRKVFNSILAVYGVYWWSAEGGRQLKLDHSALRPNETGKLREFVSYGFGRSFPLTHFMMIFALRNCLVSPLAMLLPSGRRRVYEWCFYYADQNSHIRKHVENEVGPHFHHDITANLSKGHKGKANLHENDEGCSEGEEVSFGSSSKGGKLTAAESTGKSHLIQFIGPFDKLLGLGESSRRLMSAVGEVKVDCNFVCYNDGIQSASVDGDYNYHISRSAVNIIHLNAEQLPEFFLKNGDFLRESYNIIFPYWELSRISSLHLLGISLVDEVWTASTFISSLFQGQGLPVVTIGLPASRLGELRGSDFLRADRFTFLASFDAFSWPQRKNALAVVEAFLAAFGGVDNVRLIIKTQNADHVHSAHQKQSWAALKQRCSDDNRIEIINETYSPLRQKELLRSCDCFVSLHRAEGLGIDILDALASGIPVVATGYSGNMDICTEQNSWLVDYDLVPVEQNDYVFVEDGHQWADPKHWSAVSALREVYYNNKFRIKKSVIGMSDVETLGSASVIARRIFERLELVQSFVKSGKRCDGVHLRRLQ